MALDGAGSTQRAETLVGALRAGNQGAAFLELLSRSAVTSEQRMAVELLMSLGDETDREIDDAEDVVIATGNVRPTTLGPAGVGGQTDDLRAELTDLRELNDTLAAALGACRICWGGDHSCPVCAGDGRPGSSVPDVGLFNSLVAPAVRRARTQIPRGGAQPHPITVSSRR